MAEVEEDRFDLLIKEMGIIGVLKLLLEATAAAEQRLVEVEKRTVNKTPGNRIKV